MATIGNITEEAIKKFIEKQAKEDRQEDKNGATFYGGKQRGLRYPPFGLNSKNKPPIEVVAGD